MIARMLNAIDAYDAMRANLREAGWLVVTVAWARWTR